MSKDKLHELIQNLSGSEKRYFKLFLMRYSKNNDSSLYARFFDFLVKNKTYTKEETLRKNVYINAKQLNNIKIRLYNYILLSLRTYNSNTTESNRIKILEMMTNYEILNSKGLFSQGWSILKKAENTANKHEAYYLLIDILTKKKHLASTRLKSKEIKKEAVETEKRLLQITEVLKYIELFKKIYQNIYIHFKSEGRVFRNTTLLTETIKTLEDHKKLLRNFEHSYAATSLFYYIYSLAYLCTGQFNKSLTISNINLSTFYTPYIFNLDNFTAYRRAYINKTISLNMLGKYKETRNFINSIKKISNSNTINKEVEIAIFEDTFFFELESYILEFKFKNALQLIDSNKKNIDAFDDKLHNVNQQSKRYRIALSYFGALNFKEALFWINKIIKLDELKYRKDILSSVQLLNLLIHFELGNYSLVKSKIEFVSIYLDKIDRLLLPEKLFLNALSSIKLNGKNKISLFLNLKNDLESHFKSTPIDAYFFCYLDLLQWLDIKIKNLAK